MTISYDASARVQVSARDVTSGREARSEIQRGENIVVREIDDEEILTLDPVDESKHKPATGAASGKANPPRSSVSRSAAPQTPAAARPAAVKPTLPRPPADSQGIPLNMDTIATDQVGALPAALCEKCNRALDANGECPACRRTAAAKSTAAATQPKPVGPRPAQPAAKPQAVRPQVPSVKPVPSRIAPAPAPRKPESSEIMELPLKKPAAPAPKRPKGPPNAGPPKSGGSDDPGAEEFWKLPD